MDKVILSPIPMDELLQHLRGIIREEICKLSQQPNDTKVSYLSRKELAKVLGVTLPTLSSWTKLGKVKAYRIGRRVLYKSSEVDQALKLINVN